MESSLLVPYDGSRQSRSTIRYASEVFPDAAITALHAIEPFSAIPDEETPAKERYAQTYETARDLLSEARQRVDDSSRDVSTEFIYGHPIHSILRYANLYTFDQIVIGRYGGGETADDALGNITDAIVRRAEIPVTVVRSAPDDVPVTSPGSVLVPFDGSPPSREALRYAIETFPEATVHVLYIRYPSVDDIDRPGVWSSDHSEFEAWYDAVREWHARTDRDPESILQIAESIANDTDTDVQSVVETGTPPRAILDYLDRIGADHLTIGSHSRDAGTRIFLGSVAQSVARHSPAPVTIVR